jgi:alpha-L-fucosidase
MNGGTKYESDVLDPKYADFYGPAERSELQPSKAYRDDWLARTAELVDLYRPELVWFDWWIEEPAWETYLQRFATYYYNRGAEWDREVAINHKYDAFPPGAAVFDVERGQLADIRPVFWQTDTSVSKNSWSYITNHDYKPVLSLIADLVDIVAKNGALLLNIGPKPDGTIPEPEVRMLEEIGAWLDVNGEAIYGTTHWKIAGEGPTAVPEGAFTDTARSEYTAADIRFTVNIQGDLCVTLLAPTAEKTVLVRSLASSSGVYTDEIESINLLGSKETVKFRRRKDGLVIDMPAGAPTDTLLSFKVVAVKKDVTPHTTGWLNA